MLPPFPLPLPPPAPVAPLLTLLLTPTDGAGDGVQEIQHPYDFCPHPHGIEACVRGIIPSDSPLGRFTGCVLGDDAPMLPG
jgi:hypothetical protein